MRGLFQTITEKLTDGHDAVLCSIIASSGSTPRGKGAKMAAFSDGNTYGTIGGGAVEYQSLLLAKEALRTGKTFTKGFELSPNQNADIGMVCGGSVVVYFQYFSHADEKAKELFGYILSLFEDDEEAWLITHIAEGGVRQMGTYRRDTGLRFIQGVPFNIIKPMLKSRGVLLRNIYVADNESQQQETEQQPRQKAEPQTPQTKSQTQQAELQTLKSDSSLYVEPLVSCGTVYVFGGGHVSQELVPVIAHVGFRVVVYEDRPDFATEELFPAAQKLIVAPFTELFDYISIRERDYVIIMTRGHQADYEILNRVMRTASSYVGVIGSRNKKEVTFKRLLGDGITEKELQRIHTPIGLPIKAETPAEIAISIAGELICHRAQRSEELAGTI